MAINVDGSGLINFGRAEPTLDFTVKSPDGHITLDFKGGGIYVVEGEHRRFLASGSYPVFLKDGKRVLFWTDAPARDSLALINLDGTGERTLHIPEGGKSPVSLSPDGYKLAVSTHDYSASAFGVYVVNLNDSTVRRIDCGSTGSRRR
jgi:Tol biopolymer transport system component